MRRSAYRLLAASLLLATATAAQAAEGKRWYRYYNDQHVMSINDSVTAEHLKYGYDILDKQMQLLQHVPPAPNEKDKEAMKQEKLRKEMAAQQAKDDAKLLQLYSSSADATRTRDRQLDALKLRIQFLNATQNNLRKQRATEAERAAGIERSGRPIPKEITEKIKKLDEKSVAGDKEIKEKEAELTKVEAEFAPIIKRLDELRALRANPQAVQ